MFEFEEVRRLLDAGGGVAYVLVVVSLAMWTCAGLRALVLVGAGRSPPVYGRRAWNLREAARCEAYGVVLESLVRAAPLLGLLGTVSGMVETFASLRPSGGVALTHATEQTVANGISVALITTQLGLVIGIGGLMAARALDRWEARCKASLGRGEAV